MPEKSLLAGETQLSKPTDDLALCHICGSLQVSLVSDYARLPRVTSDCAPFPSSGKLGTCHHCHCTTNPADEQWSADVQQIYESYAVFPLGEGSQPTVFGSGATSSRVEKLAEKLRSKLDIESRQGRLLDVGCSNGALFKAFAKSAPHWKMVGFEVDERYRSEVEAIPGVESFHSGKLNEIPGPFEIVTLVHVLEHVPSPVQWLENLRSLLAAGGHLLVQVPDATQNPFDLVVADHCTHFTLTTLEGVINNAGFETVLVTNEWIPKELSILATPRNAGERESVEWIAESSYSAAAAVRWLKSTADQVCAFSKSKCFGVFGSSIAATWVALVLDEKIDFFVDEDPTRVGKLHLGKPIYSPQQIPSGSDVFVGLAPKQAGLVAQRLASDSFRVHVPVSLPF